MLIKLKIFIEMQRQEQYNGFYFEKALKRVTRGVGVAVQRYKILKLEVLQLFVNKSCILKYSNMPEIIKNALQLAFFY